MLNQIAGVGDGFARDLPPWIDTVKSLYPEIPVYGSVREGHQMLWRIIGPENVMLWIGLYPEEVARFVERICAFSRGGGYIFQSDHSVPSNVSGEDYDYPVRLVREWGR